MQRPSSWITDILFCTAAFLLGYLAFALTGFWLYGDFWTTIRVGLPPHAPVTAFYTATLIFLRRRWPHFVTHGALLACGFAMGWFPALGALPVYFFRVDAMLLILCIHVAVLAIIVFVAYWIVRLGKRSLKT